MKIGKQNVGGILSRRNIIQQVKKLVAPLSGELPFCLRELFTTWRT